MGQAFLQNPIAKMATTWFGDKERGLATAFGSMASPVGCLISFLLPNAFFFGDYDPRSRFEFYLLMHTIVITLISVPTWIFLRERPPSPPS